MLHKSLPNRALVVVLSLLFTQFIFAQQSIYPATDSVQSILRSIAFESPDQVSYIHETSRWYLKHPRPEAVSEDILIQLQDAFYYDIEAICRLYGWQYLVNWRVLASKAARESFWGTSYLCNRTNNYFGIRSKNKEWICDIFNFCETVERNDPDPSDFAVFDNFESSLWMFIHTIYSPHFLERLPDQGERILAAIEYERKKGHPYWQMAEDGEMLSSRLSGSRYTA